jgi:hypothetical protein
MTTYNDTDIYKYNKGNNQNLSELRDKVECVQRSQAHIQEHIAESQAETQIEIRALRNEVKSVLRYFLQQG